MYVVICKCREFIHNPTEDKNFEFYSCVLQLVVDIKQPSIIIVIFSKWAPHIEDHH